MAPCTITSDLAWKLGMSPDCLLPVDPSEIPHFRDEYGGGWYWLNETFEEPKKREVSDIDRAVCRFHDAMMWTRIVISQHPTHDDGDDYA